MLISSPVTESDRLRLVAPCPAVICRPTQTLVSERVQHISSPVVHEVHKHSSSSSVYESSHRETINEVHHSPARILQQKVTKIVPAPIIQQKVESIVQEPVVEHIVQEPVVQQTVEHVVQKPVTVIHHSEKIIQKPETIVETHVVHKPVHIVEHHVHKPVVSLRITACPEGHYLSPDGTHCKHIDCERGFQFSDTLLRCVDTDECQVPTACLHDEQCINTYGSYICRKICTDAGYRLNEARNSCEDINECILGLHSCGPQQNCINTPGSYRCECPAGYRISGPRCDDINECAESHSHLCPFDTSICENTPGSYYCKCKQGFEKDFRDRCVDVDECIINNGGCSQRCVNKYGSYECHCNNGYVLLW